MDSIRGPDHREWVANCLEDAATISDGVALAYGIGGDVVPATIAGTTSWVLRAVARFVRGPGRS